MSVVGWYHSHPDFQPNPSITDIENQASYQQLFQGDNLSDRDSGDIESVSPFVGLIVGTYDGKNPSSQSVMRWFHCRKRSIDAEKSKFVNFPMNLKTTNRHFRKMAFDTKHTENSIRRSMTLRGTDIRRVLESRFLCCPISGVHNADMKNAKKVDARRQIKQMMNFGKQNDCLGKDNQSVVVPSEKVKDYETGMMTANGHEKVRTNESKKVAKEKYSLSMIETGQSPLLLSESLLFGPTRKSKHMWNFHPARPLYFTGNERSILEMKHDTVPDDVIAGIIWFAVEREQQMVAKRDVIENSRLCLVIPASSRSILELLLRQSLTSPNSLHRKLYCIIHCLEDSGSMSPNIRFDENDAAIFHNVDVLLGHYAPKHNRINPFSSWPGAGDKGNITKDCNGLSSVPSFLEFYFTEIMKMNLVQTDEGQVYRGGIKMKRGHKIASSLLKWTRNMQLGPISNKSDERAAFPLDNSHGIGLHFDHEQKLRCGQKTADAIPPQHCQYIYFVSEVMRLLASRWRECGARKPVPKAVARQGAPKKRGRPRKIRHHE